MKKILFFGADHCGQCHAFRPKVEDICKQKGYDFEFVDADDDNNSGILATYAVRSIPYVVILEDGTMMWKGLAVDAINNTL